MAKTPEITMAVFEAIEELMSFPAHLTLNSQAPDERDIKRFKKLMEDFSATDYDALVQERNCENRCGYVFCPFAKRIIQSKDKYHLDRVNEKFVLVPKTELEKWCRRLCERSSAWVRNQLPDGVPFKLYMRYGYYLDVVHQQNWDERYFRWMLLASEERDHPRAQLGFEDMVLNALPEEGLGERIYRPPEGRTIIGSIGGEYIDTDLVREGGGSSSSEWDSETGWDELDEEWGDHAGEAAGLGEETTLEEDRAEALRFIKAKHGIVDNERDAQPQTERDSAAVADAADKE